MYLSSFNVIRHGMRKHRDGNNTNPPSLPAFAFIKNTHTHIRCIMLIENLRSSGKSTAMLEPMKDATVLSLLFLSFPCSSDRTPLTQYTANSHHFQLVSSPSHLVLCPSFPICKADWPWQLFQAHTVIRTQTQRFSPHPHPSVSSPTIVAKKDNQLIKLCLFVI